MSDMNGEAEFDQWAAGVLAKVREERNAAQMKVIEEAVGPLERTRFHMRQILTDVYTEAHKFERELIVIEDRIKFCNRAIRTGEVPRGVDIERFGAYGKSIEVAEQAPQPEKEEIDERNDDRSGVRGVGTQRAVPRPRNGRGTSRG